MALQADGKILVGGAFDEFDGNPTGRIARLNADGTLDTAFTTNLGPDFNDNVHALVVQADGKILAGGEFENVNGNTSNRIARFDGTAPAPTVVSVAPASGPVGGGTAITITGTGFDPGAIVVVGGVPCVVTSFSTTQIICTTPAGPRGAVNVKVTNPDAQEAVALNGFTYVVAPTPTPKPVQRQVLLTKPPTRIKNTGKTVIFKKTPKTNAGQNAKVTVTCRALSRAIALRGDVMFCKVIKGKNGKITISIQGKQKVKVTVRMTAKKVRGYTSMRKSYSYITSASGKGSAKRKG